MEKVQRQWGEYIVLEDQPGLYKVKTLIVKPGATLSVQMHEHRMETWTVVSGTGIARVHDMYIDISKGDVTVIEKNQIHSLRCTSDTPLILVEVQIGNITEEDDITRFNEEF